MNIKEIAYELYKRKWIREHISQREELDTYINYSVNHNIETITFEEYIEKYGYTNSMVYSCFEAFLYCEYKDLEYVTQLFGHSEDGYELFNLYLEDRGYVI